MATHIEYVELDPFDITSIIEAQRRLHGALEDFDEKVDEFIQRLAEIGQRAAQGAYGNAVDVELTPTDGGVILSASGKAVVFFEFGAGTRVSTGNRFAGKMPFEVSSGSYSRSPEGSGEFAAKGKWEFPPGSGIMHEYVEPRNGMEKAYEAMLLDIQTVIRAVFG